MRLRRQVYALEEAGLVAGGDDRDAKRGQRLGPEDPGRRAGGGPLDSSWLNARANDKVGKGMERELWAQAKALADRLQAGTATNGSASDAGAEKEDEQMEVDRG